MSDDVTSAMASLREQIAGMDRLIDRLEPQSSVGAADLRHACALVMSRFAAVQSAFARHEEEASRRLSIGKRALELANAAAKESNAAAQEVSAAARVIREIETRVDRLERPRDPPPASPH